MSTIHRVELDSTLRCTDAVDFERRLRERIVGQDEAIDRVTWMVQTFMAGFNPPGRPAGILLFLGPTRFPHLERLENVVPSSPPPLRPLSSSLPPEPLGSAVCQWKERGLRAINSDRPHSQKNFCAHPLALLSKGYKVNLARSTCFCREGKLPR